MSGRLRLEAAGRSGGEGPRGYVDIAVAEGGRPVRFDIHLLRADRSTLAHESFHVLSKILGEVASRPDAPPELKADYQRFLEELGYSSHDERLGVPDAAKEEKGSHLWEMYLAEGRAPAPGLRGAFARFKGWMARIYRGVTGIGDQYRQVHGVGLELSDDVRQIFDRILASQDEIDAAKRELEPRPPADLEALSPAERARYERLDADERQEAERSFVERAAEDDRRETAAAAKAFAAKIRAQVERELVDVDPGYRAAAYLQRGEIPGSEGAAELLAGEDGPRKLDRAKTVARAGPDATGGLPRGIFERGKGGADPEELAARFGFPDGKALVTALAGKDFEAQAAEAIRRAVDARFGPALLDDPARARGAAREALANEPGAKKLFLRLEAIARTLDPSFQRRLQGMSFDALREIAWDRLRERPLRSLSPERFAAMAARAADRGNQAWAEGRREAAWREVDAQIWHRAFTRAAAELREAADKAQTLVERTKGETWRAELGKASPVYLAAHDALLGALGISGSPRPDGPEAVLNLFTQLASDADGVTLEAGAEGQSPRFVSPNWDADAIADIVRNPRRWSDLTPDQALNVRDLVKNLRHLANERNELELDGRRADRNAIIDEAIATAERNLPKQPLIPRDPLLADSYLRNARLVGQSFDALLMDVQTMAHMLDGGDREGVFHRLFLDERLQARDASAALTSRFLGDILSKWEAAGIDRARLYERIDVSRSLPLDPELAKTWGDGEVTRANLIMIALNLGNDSNAERLLGGYHWSREQVLGVLQEHLNAREWRWVQDVWDALEHGGATTGPSLFEAMAEAHRKDTGLDMPKIPRRPFTVSAADGELVEMQGGYFPARYDPRPGSLKKTGEKQVLQDVADFFQGNYQRAPSVAAPHAKQRAAHYQDTVNLDWGIVPAHVAQVIHDIAYRAYVKRLAAILLDSRFNNALVQRLGEQRAKQWRPWLHAVANVRADSIPANLGPFWRLMETGRRVSATAALGWSLPRAVANLADPLVAVANGSLSAPQLLLSTAKLMVPGSGAWGDAQRFVLQNSSEARDRLQNVQRHLQQQMAAMGGKAGLQHPVLRALRETSFATMEMVDKLVVTLSWMARYEQSRAELGKQGYGPEEGHERAVKGADDVVRSILPPHEVPDQPAIIRDRRGLGALLLFYGHANKIWNLERRAASDMMRTWRSDEASTGMKIGAAAKFAGTVAAVSVVNGVISEWLAGRGQEDDEDVGDYIARKSIATLFYPLPFVGAAGDVIAGKLLGLGHVPAFSIRNAPSLAYAQDVTHRIGTAVDAWQNGDSNAGTSAMQAAEIALGYAAGAPTRQADRTLSYVGHLVSGETEPRGPLDVLGGLVYGQDARGAANPLTTAQSISPGGSR